MTISCEDDSAMKLLTFQCKEIKFEEALLGIFAINDNITI